MFLMFVMFNTPCGLKAAIHGQFYIMMFENLHRSFDILTIKDRTGFSGELSFV